MVTRKNIKLAMTLALAVVIGWGSLGIATTAYAATCYADECNGIDPYGTTCWGDKYIAARKFNGSLDNRNYYSPGCVANFSYTYYPSLSWLAAETVGVYTYKGDKLYLYVWNSMWDGRSTVCTRGHRGPSYNNYNQHTVEACA